MNAPNVRCANCGNVYSGEFIRCAICKTTARVSRAFWARAAERKSDRQRRRLLLPLLAVGAWGLFAALAYALTG